MVVIVTVVGILSAFVLLASYCAFVTKCQLLRLVLSRVGARHGAGEPPSSSVIVRDGVASEEEQRQQMGLGLPLIRMLPVVKFTADARGRKLSVSSECGVCLSEFEEMERVRLLPACSHAFHIDCIDTWLQGSARCPFCRADVTVPPLPVPVPAGRHGRDDDGQQLGERDSVVVEVRSGEQESRGRKSKKKESVGDEAVDTRSWKKEEEEEEFAVQPAVRRSLSMNSATCGDRLCVSVVREFLAAQRQVCDQ